MHPKQNRGPGLIQGLAHCLVSSQHKLLNQQMGLITLQPGNGTNAVSFKRNIALRNRKAQGPSLHTLPVKQIRKLFGFLQHGQQGFMFPTRFLVAKIDRLMNRIIGKTLMAADQTPGKFGPGPAALLIKIQDSGKGGAILVRNQRAEIIGKPFRQHG